MLPKAAPVLVLGALLETNAALKRFLRRKVYFSDLLGMERAHSAKMISELFQFFLDHPDRRC